MGVDIETAALRVFSNAEGAYGSNVNHLIDSGAWDEEEELADAYEKRKSFAYGRDGKCAQQGALLKTALEDVELAYQNRVKRPPFISAIPPKATARFAHSKSKSHWKHGAAR